MRHIISKNLVTFPRNPQKHKKDFFNYCLFAYFNVPYTTAWLEARHCGLRETCCLILDL